MSEPQIEVGYERDRFGPPSAWSHLTIRWWLFLFVPGEKLRNQRARQGVVDRGFRFARGGRAATEEEARRLLSAAHSEAQREVDFWRGQPSHALAPNGDLVPLDELLPELPA